jgi:hypothetical protein
MPEFLQRNKLLLGLLAGVSPLVVAEGPAPGQYVLAERSLWHTLFL